MVNWLHKRKCCSGESQTPIYHTFQGDLTSWHYVDVTRESAAASNRRRETICLQSIVVELQPASFVSVFFSHLTVFSNAKFPRTTGSRSVLKDAVISYMDEIGDGPHEDVMRAFFRYHVADIAKLLKKVLDIVHASSTASNSNLLHILPEANRVVLVSLVIGTFQYKVFTPSQTVLRSALEYRDYNLEVYGIDLPIRKPWTSRPSAIDSVLSLFDLSTKVLETSGGSSIQATDREPGTQLPTLAAILFESVKERLDELSKLLFMNFVSFILLIIAIFLVQE